MCWLTSTDITSPNEGWIDPPVEPWSVQVNQDEDVGWIAIQQGIHTLPAQTGVDSSEQSSKDKDSSLSELSLEDEMNDRVRVRGQWRFEMMFHCVLSCFLSELWVRRPKHVDTWQQLNIFLCQTWRRGCNDGGSEVRPCGERRRQWTEDPGPGHHAGDRKSLGGREPIDPLGRRWRMGSSRGCQRLYGGCGHWWRCDLQQWEETYSRGGQRGGLLSSVRDFLNSGLLREEPSIQSLENPGRFAERPCTTPRPKSWHLQSGRVVATHVWGLPGCL